jgi:hypothetical protein
MIEMKYNAYFTFNHVTFKYARDTTELEVIDIDHLTAAKIWTEKHQILMNHFLGSNLHTNKIYKICDSSLVVIEIKPRSRNRLVTIML